MTKKRNTKQALLTSLLALVLCISMLVGTTFAWFTDSVISENNIIKSGTLDVAMEWAKGDEDPTDSETVWTDAATGPIFNCDKWEPGYTEVRHIKISNKGTLALKYKLGIIAYGEVSELTDVIDVYYVDPATKAIANRTDLEGVDVLGTLTEVLDNIKTTGEGTLDPETSIIVTVAFKMQESAGNEYQDLAIGSSFAVQLLATQLTAEEDSFDEFYDEEAEYKDTINGTYDWYLEDPEATEFTVNTPSDLAGLADIVNGSKTPSEMTGITTYATEEENVQDSFKGKTIMLDADIDLANKEWIPIGNSTYRFEGTFDGKEHTISNLSISRSGKSNVGLFGFTQIGEIKNVTVENADVVGRLNVGVVAGTPHTSKYTNITVKGNVKVKGMAYVGGVVGKNAYANLTDITVDVTEGSFVKANSVEDGTAYRTYVGGVVGFMGEGSHKVTNVTSNIDVIGSTCDVGGITGIAHYGNTFENCESSGDVTITNASEAAEVEEMGGIAGVWHNGGNDVTFTNCKYTGTLSANITEGVDLSDNTITGKAYSDSGTGKLIIDGSTVTSDVTTLDTALQKAGNVKMQDNLTINAEDTTANSGYGATGVSVKGGVLDGNGKTLTVNNANGTWDCVVHTTGGTIKNITVAGAMRGIFMGSAAADVYIDNVVFEDVVYTFNSDGGSKDYGVYISNSTLNGWTSFSNVHKIVEFTDCKFGEGRGYAFCRPYNESVFTNCVFEEGFEFDTSKTSDITFVDCYYGDTLITAENAESLGNGDTTFFYNGLNGITIKVK